MEDGWENDLDLDDSDLLSLQPTRVSPPRFISLTSVSPLRRCAQISHIFDSRSEDPPLRPPPAEEETEEPSFTPQRRIPGPAGAVQAAMSRKAAAARDRDGHSPEESELRCVFGDEDGEMDEDFLQNPWLSALEFLAGDGNASDRSIDSIKSLVSVERALKLAVIVKSCKSNGLGDLFVILKDPTGSIGASVQRKVLTDGNFGVEISVGCVIILKQVAVFSPSPTTRYLNITLNNVVKIFGRDGGLPVRHVSPRTSTIARPPSSPAQRDGKQDLRVPSPKRKTTTAASGVEAAAPRDRETHTVVAAPQWTDEELSLLFSDDQDLSHLPI